MTTKFTGQRETNRRQSERQYMGNISAVAIDERENRVVVTMRDVTEEAAASCGCRGSADGHLCAGPIPESSNATGKEGLL